MIDKISNYNRPLEKKKESLRGTKTWNKKVIERKTNKEKILCNLIKQLEII